MCVCVVGGGGVHLEKGHSIVQQLNMACENQGSSKIEHDFKFQTSKIRLLAFDLGMLWFPNMTFFHN